MEKLKEKKRVEWWFRVSFSLGGVQQYKKKDQYRAHYLLAKNMRSCWSFDLYSTAMELPKKTGYKRKWAKRESSKLEGRKERKRGQSWSFSHLDFTTVQPSFWKRLWYHRGPGPRLEVGMWLLKQWLAITSAGLVKWGFSFANESQRWELHRNCICTPLYRWQLLPSSFDCCPFSPQFGIAHRSHS